jgi:hypothetical protein
MTHRFDFGAGAALVTGASRGIGAAFARDLAHRGTRTFLLTARSLSDLSALADELRTQHPGLRVETILADLAQENGAQTVYAEVERIGVPVHLLINNAGFGSHGAFETLPPNHERDMVQVNVASLLELTRLFLPAMIERKAGAILNVSSALAFQPVPYMATYGATKAWVQSFSEALWGEMRDRQTGVRVLCLCPGVTTTHFADTMRQGPSDKAPRSTPERVAKVGLDALHSESPYVVVGNRNYIASFAPRLLPRAALPRLVAPLFRPADVAPAQLSPAPLASEMPNSVSPRWNRSISFWAVGAGVLIGAVLAGRKR